MIAAFQILVFMLSVYPGYTQPFHYRDCENKCEPAYGKCQPTDAAKKYILKHKSEREFQALIYFCLQCMQVKNKCVNNK